MSHEGREARFIGRIITTAQELDALPSETSLLDEQSGAPWGLHWRFPEGSIRESHRQKLIEQLPLKITYHPDDQIVEMRQWALKAHDAEVAAAARATLLSEAMKYSNKRATPSGPFVWSVTLGELEQIINRANGASR